MDLNADIEWAKVFAWAVGMFGGFLAWAGKRQVGRIDQHGKRLDKLEQNVAQKHDIDEMEKRLHSHITTVSNHIAERLGDVKATAEKAHDRIDRIPSHDVASRG